MCPSPFQVSFIQMSLAVTAGLHSFFRSQARFTVSHCSHRPVYMILSQPPTFFLSSLTKLFVPHFFLIHSIIPYILTKVPLFPIQKMACNDATLNEKAGDASEAIELITAAFLKGGKLAQSVASHSYVSRALFASVQSKACRRLSSDYA